MSNQLFKSLARYATGSLVLREGETLFFCDDVVKSVFLVEEGRLILVRNQRDGAMVLLNRSQDGEFVAEASVYSTRYHCSCIAETRSKLLRLPLAVVKKQLAHDPEIARLWAAHLAGELQNTRYRCEILTRNTVSERLSGWLERGKKLPQKGLWKNLAAEIGVSPEALYREIAKRKVAG